MTIPIEQMIIAVKNNTRDGMSDHMEDAIIDHLQQPANNAELVGELQDRLLTMELHNNYIYDKCTTRIEMDLKKKAWREFFDKVIAALSAAPTVANNTDLCDRLHDVGMHWPGDVVRMGREIYEEAIAALSAAPEVEQPANPSELADEATELLSYQENPDKPISGHEWMRRAGKVMKGFLEPELRQQPFDVLQWLRDGGHVADGNGATYRIMNGDTFMWKLYDGWVATQNTFTNRFCEALLAGTLKPYTAPEVLADGWWYWCKRNNGEVMPMYLCGYGVPDGKPHFERYKDECHVWDAEPLTNPDTGKPWKITEPSHD